MAELVLRLVDRVHPEFYTNLWCTKGGDIVVAHDDGWKWGTKEYAHADWRILRVPMSRSEARTYVAPEPETDPRQPSRTLQARLWTCHIDRLSAAWRARLNAAQGTVLDMPRDVFESMLKKKPPVPDPHILGASRFVL